MLKELYRLIEQALQIEDKFVQLFQGPPDMIQLENLIHRLGMIGEFGMFLMGFARQLLNKNQTDTIGLSLNRVGVTFMCIYETLGGFGPRVVVLNGAFDEDDYCVLVNNLGSDVVGPLARISFNTLHPLARELEDRDKKSRLKPRAEFHDGAPPAKSARFESDAPPTQA